jgi:hypothetical protein
VKRPIRHVLCTTLAVFGALLARGDAEAQHRPPPLAEAAAWQPRLDAAGAGGVLGSPTPFSRVVAGSALGTVSGAAVGAGLGLLVYLVTEQPDGNMFGPLGEVVILGGAGAVVGSWVGSRRANRGAGDPWVTALGSLGGAAAGIGLGYVVGETTGSLPLGIAVGVPVAIVVPAVAERLGTR